MSLLLLVPERNRRIDSARSPGWNPAGQRSNTQEKRGDTDENGKVDYALGNRVHGNHECKHPSNRRASCDHTQVFANNLLNDPAASGPERQPHANLSRSSGHGVGNYCVDAHRRKAEQDWTEHDEHARRNRAERRALPIRVWFHGRCAS